jgi:hypothetical protein
MSFGKSLRAALALGFAMSFGIASAASAQNLLVNGGFEASSDGFVTPPGWTNIGPSTGVVPYALIGPGLTPYEGNNFYTLGGPGTNGLSAVGWGISQSVVTTSGNTYRLTFGLSDENGPNLETVLGVNIGGNVTPFTLTATNTGFFTRQFATMTIDYVATAALTNISFTLLSTNERGLVGNNDPLIDGVVFEQIAVGNPGVPEPATWAMMLGGFGLMGAAVRRRQRAAVSFG